MPCRQKRRWTAIAQLAASLIVAAPAGPSGAAVAEPVVTASGQYAIETDSLGPSARIPGATGVWVRFAPTLSVDCSPPRGCYANTQRLYYAFSCSPRYAVLAERISMDLNGTVIKRETTEAYTTAIDAPAALVLDAYCPLRDRDRQPGPR